MKSKLAVLLLSLAIVLISSAAEAGPVVDPVKWSQQPDLNPATGLDVYSEETFGPGVADDFMCLNGLPVTDIHWWGSYLGQPIVKPAAFVIEFYADIPAGTGGINFSRPGASLYWALVAFGQCNETPVGGGVFQYSVELSEDLYFHQQKNTIYWLSIRGWTWQGPVPNWGWHNSAAQWNDDAVTGGPPFVGPWNPLVYPVGHPWAGQSMDMAFELTTIPEPSGILAAASGLFGLAAFSIRRKRR